MVRAKSLIPHLLIIALIGWAFRSNPYAYYTILRWIVCIVFVFLAIQSFDKRQAFAWAWIAAAGIYNPVIPVHATREFWTSVNIATIALVIIGALVTSKSKTLASR